MTSSTPSCRRAGQEGPLTRRKSAIIAVSVAVLVAVVCVFWTLNRNDSKGDHRIHQTGWKTTSRIAMSACNRTRYPDMCMALQVSLESAQNAHAMGLSLSDHSMNAVERAAWRDCLELFEDTMDRLNVCLSHSSALNSDSDRQKYSSEDVQTWLSAAITNQETCLDGLRDLNITSREANLSVKALLSSGASKASALLSNSLAICKTSTRSGGEAVHGLHNRRLLSSNIDDPRPQDLRFGNIEEDGFPQWLTAGERRLLQRTSSPASQANAVVAKDGTGNHKTITEAVDSAPKNSRSRYVIYIKAGVYDENVVVSKEHKNLMLLGDGKDRTVVTGNRNVRDGSTTFRSATFAVSGDGFMAKDMTFQNTAGPEKHQAVALRVGADLSVLYRCSFKGYQDTLYVYSLRQFYREVDVHGTVDFIFGNAAVVFQNSNIFARRPLGHQKNTITAQGRSDPNQNTGISIHNCKVSAASDLQPVISSIKTYLGRPWKQYSRTVFMQSTLDDLIDPAGWAEWNGNFALRTLFYGEYSNSGEGAGTARRVKWPGFRVITSSAEASKFTVGKFISGNSWIPATAVPFTSDLS